MKSDAQSIFSIFLDKNRKDKRINIILSLAQINGLKVNFSSKDEIKKLSGGKKTQGMIAVAKKKLFSETLEELIQNLNNLHEKKYPTLVFLDGVTDPRNLGAILRISESQSVGAVIASMNNSVPINETVIKASCGASDFVSYIRVPNLCRAIERVQDIGYEILGLDPEGEKSLFSVELIKPIGFVFGGEGPGLKLRTKEICNRIIKLPMHGKLESLNVSSVCAITLFENYRQRNKN